MAIRASQLLWLLAAVAGLALASQVEIPMEPVPITLQTLAVVLTGFLLGPRLAFIATAIWLAGGAAGLPFFAGGESGLDHLTGPTAGYLLSMPFAAALAGFGAQRSRREPVWLFVTAIAAHLLVLSTGGWCLSTRIGLDAAMAKGVIPFLPGAVLKSVVAVIVTKLVGARFRRP